MSVNSEEKKLYKPSSFKTQFNEYEIELTLKKDISINILIKKKNVLYYYESSFNKKNLQKKLNINDTINNIYQEICRLIDNKKFEINFILLSLLMNDSYIEFIIEISIKTLLSQINELNQLKHNNYKIKIKDIIIIIIFIIVILLNNKIDKLEKNIIKEINNKIDKLEKKIITELNNNKIKEINNKLDILENNKIKELNDKLDELENNNITEINNKTDKPENNNIKEINNKREAIQKEFDSLYQYTYLNLTYINSVKTSNSIYSISIFPSGNIISTSYKSLIIYDKNFNIIQTINNAHNSIIYYVDIYDENNFVTCSDDQNIKTWIKNNNNNEYSINKIINNAHNKYIDKVIYNSKGNLISCSSDGLIKIWELKNEEYKKIKTINHSGYVSSTLLLEDKNILISSGLGTKFWNLTNNNNIVLLKSFGSIYTNFNKGLERIDNDKIIICSNFLNHKLVIVSISKLKIIKEININYNCYSIKFIKNKAIFLIGGYTNDKNIYFYNI